MAAKHNNDQISHLVVAVLLMLNIVYSPWHARVTEAATPTAKPGCQQQCGNMVVPYPFGIGNSSCFHDEWFEMECADNSTNPNPNTKPVLKKLKLEVTRIDLPTPYNKGTGWLLFNNPIIASSSNCTSGTGSKATPNTPLDMTGSTFYFSPTYNSFAGSGCTNQVSMIDSKGKELPDTQCLSTCPQDTKIGSCCVTAIPSSIQLFNASFSSTSTDDGDCKYAMLVAIEEWLDLNPGMSCSSGVRDADTVPAWFEWGLRPSSADAIALEKQGKAENTTIVIYPYTYKDGTDIQFAYCAEGFIGSAYVPNGCEDVDECLDSPCTNGTCTNTYGSYHCIVEESKMIQIAIIVAAPIAVVLVIILAIWGGFKLRKRRQEKKFFIQNGGPLLQTEGNAGRTRVFKVHQLRKATNHFSKKNRLGGGGQGTVYKGTLPGGTTVVAIKECKKPKPSRKPKNSKAVERSIEAEDEMGAFITEVVLLSETIHKNIVKLLGCCLETEAPLLVYEYLVNGDLSQHLQNDENTKAEFTLSWEVRLRIAADIAGALSYLHFSAGVPIYHRDIKSDNILLDNRYTAKLADFGISKSLAANESRVNVAVQGSAGYMDPEYMDSRQYTDKSDVYSFGVVLAELLTGKRPVFSYTSVEGEERTGILADHFKSLKTAQLMATFLDARVRLQGNENEVKVVIGIAKRCLEREGRNRPTMRIVARELENIRDEHTDVYARETDEHDYDQSLETITVSPIGGTPARPLRRQGSQTSDA